MVEITVKDQDSNKLVHVNTVVTKTFHVMNVIY